MATAGGRMGSDDVLRHLGPFFLGVNHGNRRSLFLRETANTRLFARCHAGCSGAVIPLLSEHGCSKPNT
jgi:hypothetical protein